MSFIERLRHLARTNPALRPLHRFHVESRARRRANALARSLLATRAFSAAEARAIARDWLAVSAHTQLSQSGIVNLEICSRYVVGNAIAGGFVECGTWRGGALSFWARAFMRNGGRPETNRLFGFDSFEGMPGMTIEDGPWVAELLHGKPLATLTPEELQGALRSHEMNRAEHEACRRVVAASGFPAEHTEIVKGWFQESLPLWREKIGPIAVLRLDGDFYESTRVCLEQLYDQVVPGGLIVIDDYVFFEGCQRAVQEFHRNRGLPLNLIHVDECVRFLVKP